MTSESLQSLYGWSAPDGAAGARADDELHVPPPLWERMQAFGLSERPRECCAVGIGAPGRIAEFIPVANVHAEPVTRYEIAADDQLRIHKRAMQRDHDVTLVFHTHPATEAYPSPTDVAIAAWPDAAYAILSLAGKQPHLRAFRIVDGEIAELPVRMG